MATYDYLECFDISSVFSFESLSREHLPEFAAKIKPLSTL